MVGVARLELATSWSQTTRASQLRYTPPTLFASLKATAGRPVSLYQKRGMPTEAPKERRLVPRGGIEPPTQGSSGLCSTTELPWLKVIVVVGMGGLEPPTPTLSV